MSAINAIPVRITCPCCYHRQYIHLTKRMNETLAQCNHCKWWHACTPVCSQSGEFKTIRVHAMPLADDYCNRINRETEHAKYRQNFLLKQAV